MTSNERTDVNLLADALEWLRGLDGVPPQDARERLASLRARHPGTPMRLLWQREEATGDFHYDLLFPAFGETAPGESACGETVSLSVAPDRAIPWPLRGGQRSGNHVLLAVNGAEVTWEEAVSALDVLWEDGRLARRLVDAVLVDHVLAARDTELPPDRLQHAMDAFRRARGLLTGEATRRWMTERGLSHARLEQIVAGEAAVAELRRDVVANLVEEHFAAHRADFDRLRLVRLRYAAADGAREAAARLRDGADPLAAAMEGVLAGVATCRMEANHRDELVMLFGSAAERAGAGDVLGPVRLPDGGFCVARVLAVEPAALDELTRLLVERRIFDEWLADRRREAHLEWFWGSRARTDAATAELTGRAPAAS
ncbi:TIGR04500 family putative peptide maturation system protein [Nonomuraea sp. NPDC003804]|uniref:TIGR04500 family putative peptide maturation system protein n=1 Tax=Nonomuraea sp. NPDC003804 TaxID=3154547 RepID=UPI00339E4361